MISLVACVLLASGGDFDPEETRWRGLSYLETTANEAKVTLSTTDALDWLGVKRGDVMIFIRPRNVRAEDVLDFVLDGGHAIILYDRGDDDAIARRFGLELAEDPVLHDRYFQDHPGFPMLVRPGASGADDPLPESEMDDAHFLWFNVNSIVLNHPAALVLDKRARGKGEPEVLIPFAEPGQAFAIEVRRGRGYALFLSDSSILINDMQQHAYGDKQLAANILRYYCEADECEAAVVLPWASSAGRYGPPSLDGLKGLEEIFARAIEELNGLADAISTWIGRPRQLLLLSLGLLGGLLLLCLALPWPRGLRRHPWEGVAAYRPTHLEYWTRALGSARGTADFGRPILALERRLTRELQRVFGPLDGGLAAYAPRIGQLAGPDAERAALRCHETFTKVATASDRGSVRRPVRLDDADFERVWDDHRVVLVALESQ